MFVSIRRHQKWLFIVIGGATIIAFVWFFNPSSQYGGGSSYQQDRVIGTIQGRPIRISQYQDAMREISLNYFTSFQQWPDSSQIPVSLVGNRLLLLQKVEELGIRAGESAVAQWIAEAFRGPEGGAFQQDQYRRFLNEFLPDRGVTREQFERFVQHEVELRHLNAVVGGVGRLVTPQKAEDSYRREHEKADARIVFIARSNFLSQVTMDEAALLSHYSNNLALYRNPERVQVSYVQFDAATFFPAAAQRMAKQGAEVEQIVNAYYEQRGPDFFKGADGLPLPPAEAKQRIRDEEVRKSYALIEAQKAANLLIEALLDMTPKTAEAFEQKAADMGLQASVSQPFAQFETPAGVVFPPGFASTVFQLTPDSPFMEEAAVGTNAVFVAALKARIQSTPKPFEEVRAQVASDYQGREILNLMNQAGFELQQKIKSAVAEGKSFDEAVTEAGAQPVDLLPFSRKDIFVQGVPDQATLSSVKDVVFALKPGEVSAFRASSGGGFVAYLEKRVPPADDEVRQALPEYVKTLQNTSQAEAFRAWLEKERELAAISFPGLESGVRSAE